MLRLFAEFGVAIDCFPAKLRTPKRLTRPLIKLIKYDIDGAKRALEDIVEADSPTHKKRWLKTKRISNGVT